MMLSQRCLPQWAARCAALAGLVALASEAGCRAGVTRGEILYADAVEQLAAGDSAAALSLLEGAAVEAPQDARVRHQLGVLLLRRGTIEARARAEKELRIAVDLDPGVAAYEAALGEVLHLQGFSHEAQATLLHAVRQNPALGRAWYFLGLELLDEYREESSPAWRDSTILCFENTLDGDSTNANARWKLAYLLVQRGQPERARAVARRGFGRHSCPGPWGLLLTTIEFRARNIAAAAGVLDSTLACLTPQARDSVQSPQLLVHPDSAFCWGCTPAQRDFAVEAFWWGMDPTPATSRNERLVEHIVRLVDADFWFEVPQYKQAGRNTDRGEIYLRFGQPDAMWKAGEGVGASWFWNYSKVSTPQTYLFVNMYAPHTYHRMRRSSTSDYMRPELLDVAAERTLLDFGSKPRGWREVARLFRADAGRTAVELAYGFETGPELDSLHVDVAAWRSPGSGAGQVSRGVPLAELHHVDDRHVIGRLRFEVPSERLELGLQVMAAGQDSVPRPPGKSMWAWMGRDTIDAVAYDAGSSGVSDLMLAHVLDRSPQRSPRGSAFDLGGVFAVPRVDSEITTGELNLYFEIYPGEEVIRARRTLVVTYRVQAQPPRQWRFRDQFSPEKQAWRERPTYVESRFVLEPNRAVEKQSLHIDVRALEPGDYVLTVEVRPRGRTQRLSRTVDFSIPKPAPSVP
jgi:GWxTD domain-containing protein